MENETGMKNFIVEVDWGDEFPAIYFFQAESVEALENSEAYIGAMSEYPAGLPVTIHTNVDDKTFNKKLEYAKKIQIFVEERNKKRFKAIEKGIKKLEKEGKKPFAVDWNEGTIYGIKTTETPGSGLKYSRR